MTYEPAHRHDHVTEPPVVTERRVVTERPAVHDHVHGTDLGSTPLAINQAMIAVMAVIAAIVLLLVVLAWAPWNSSTGPVTPTNNSPAQEQREPSQQQAPSQQAPQSQPEQQRLPQ